MPRAALFLAIATTALALASTASPSRADTNACDLFSITQIRAIFGMHAAGLFQMIPGTSAPDNTSGFVHAVCTGFAWNGKLPTKRGALLEGLATGSVVAFAIETWEPDAASTYVDQWTSTGFDDRFGAITSGSVNAILAANLPGLRPLAIHSLKASGASAGEGAAGMTDTLFGINDPRPRFVHGVGGAWWDEQEASLIAVGFETGGKRATVARLNHFAHLVVGRFGLTPLTLH